MQLMRARDVPANPSARVFRYPRLNVIALVAILGGGASALFVSGARQGALFPQLLAAFFYLVVLATRRMCVARFRPSNWLVRSTVDGLYVQFRSYLNYHFSPDDTTVVFIPWREISSAQLVSETLRVPDVKVRIDGQSPSGTRMNRQPRKVIELQLTGDTRALGEALFAERARSAPVRKTWYGTTSTRVEHNPVLLDDAGRLHLTWEVVPRSKAFLETLAPHVRIEASASREWSYKALQELDRPALEQRIGDLARAGKTREALLLARVKFACNDEQARELVARVSRASSGPADPERGVA